jgi:integrase
VTRDESERFLATVSEEWPDFYAFFLMALRAGMRLGELLAVQWQDLDLRDPHIEVQRNLVAGKLTTPKNSNCRRVDMSAQLAKALTHHRAARQSGGTESGRASARVGVHE